MTKFRKHYWDGNPETTALLIIDLEKGYCDPNSDMANAPLNWDVSQADQLCHDAIGFINQTRRYLPAHNIIWTRMEEHQDSYAQNSPYYFDDERFVDLCVRATEGYQYHLVAPNKDEIQLHKTHPSAFHTHAEIEGNPRGSWRIENKPSSALHDYLQRGIKSEYVLTGQKHKIKTIAAIGVIDSRCVGATFASASDRGYNCLSIEGLTGSPEFKNKPSGAMSFNDEVRGHRQVRDMFTAAPISPDQFINCLKKHRPFTPAP